MTEGLRATDTGRILKLTHRLAKSWVWLAVLLGVAGYAVIFGVMILMRRSGVEWPAFQFVSVRLLERGIIPHVMTVGLTVGLSLLLIRLPMLVWEYRDLERIGSEGLPEADVEPDPNSRSGRSFVQSFLSDARLRASTCHNGAEFDSAIESLSAIERRKIDTSHVPVRYLIWLIPTLGFLGTVLGISLAVEGFSEVVSTSTGATDIKSNLVVICRELGVAFDTTFVALIYSALLALFMAYVDRRELTLINELEEMCVSRLRTDFSHRFGVAASEDASAAGAGTGGAGLPVFVLQSGEGDASTSLEDVARQAVVRALTQLSDQNDSMTRSLSESAVQLQMQEFIKANLIQMRHVEDYMQNSSLRREDVERFSAELTGQHQQLSTLAEALSRQQESTAKLLAGVFELLSQLKTEGVRANLSVVSSVSHEKS